MRTTWKTTRPTKGRLFWLHYSEFQEFGERVHSHTEAHGENWMKPKSILVVEIRETVWESVILTEASVGPDKCGHLV